MSVVASMMGMSFLWRLAFSARRSAFHTCVPESPAIVRSLTLPTLTLFERSVEKHSTFSLFWQPACLWSEFLCLSAGTIARAIVRQSGWRRCPTQPVLFVQIWTSVPGWTVAAAVTSVSTLRAATSVSVHPGTVSPTTRPPAKVSTPLS